MHLWRIDHCHDKDLHPVLDLYKSNTGRNETKGVIDVYKRLAFWIWLPRKHLLLGNSSLIFHWCLVGLRDSSSKKTVKGLVFYEFREYAVKDKLNLFLFSHIIDMFIFCINICFKTYMPLSFNNYLKKQILWNQK